MVYNLKKRYRVYGEYGNCHKRLKGETRVKLLKYD